MFIASLPVRQIARGVIAASALGLFTAAASADDDNFEVRSRSQRAKCLRTAPVVFNGDIVAAAVATPSLSTLVALLQKANLVGALSGPGPFTVFAPTNDAFAKIPAAVLTPIGSNVDLLTAVLTYHVSSEHADPRVPRNPDDVSTLQGQTLFLQSPKGVPMINQSTTSCQAVKTTNGTVWVIDSVLLPQFR
jgi:uncharacterized surface protein with fasciclin (FAS1) repeats